MEKMYTFHKMAFNQNGQLGETGQEEQSVEKNRIGQFGKNGQKGKTDQKSMSKLAETAK